MLNPYEGTNKAENPAVFCAALGLPTKDEKRLRAVWKKGNATDFNEGIWLLNVATLAVKQELRSKAQVYGRVVDGRGRFWVGSGDSTIEA